MTDSTSPEIRTVMVRPRRRLPKWGLLVGLMGFSLIAWECYVMAPIVRVAVVKILGKAGAWSWVHSFLADADAGVQLAASETLVEGGKDAVPTLLDGLAHPDAERRRSAICMLQNIGKEATAALPALVELVCKDADVRVREYAVTALPTIGAASPDVVSALARALEDSYSAVRYAAAAKLGSLGPKAQSATDALVRAVKDPAAQVRHKSVEALGSIGADARVIKVLVQALQDDVDNTVRAEAAEALGLFRGQARDAVPALIGSLKDVSERVRAESAEALGKIGPDAQAAIVSLREALKDVSPLVRGEAKRALQRIGS